MNVSGSHLQNLPSAIPLTFLRVFLRGLVIQYDVLVLLDPNANAPSNHFVVRSRGKVSTKIAGDCEVGNRRWGTGTLKDPTNIVRHETRISWVGSEELGLDSVLRYLSWDELKTPGG